MKANLLVLSLIVLILSAIAIGLKNESIKSYPAIVKEVENKLVYENKSKQGLEEYLSMRGYSMQEIDEVMKEANAEIVRAAIMQNVSRELIVEGFAIRGFTEEETEVLMQMVVVEQVKKALSEGIPLENITSALEERGFTPQEVNEIMRDAGYQPPKSGGRILLLIVSLSIVLLIILVYVWKKKSKQVASGGDTGAELTKLLDEKNRIEEMIELAKTKYHTRALDEESFREIIRDHQKKLIEIEAKIKRLESRVQKLEDKSP